MEEYYGHANLGSGMTIDELARLVETHDLPDDVTDEQLEVLYAYLTSSSEPTVAQPTEAEPTKQSK